MADRDLLAEVQLLGLIAQAHDESTPSGEDGPSREELEGAVGAAVEAGLIAEEDAPEWRLGFEHFGDDLEQPSAPNGRQDRALELLDRLVREAAAEDPERSLDAYIRFRDALSALSVVGALTEDERDWWLSRLAELSGGAYDEGDEEEPRARLLGLRGVYVGPAGATSDGFRLIAVDCYDDGVAVHWAGRRPLVGDTATWEDELELSDDVGTEYLFHGGGSDSSEEAGFSIERGVTEFSPAVPPDAGRLRVTAGGARFDFDVSGLRQRPAV